MKQITKNLHEDLTRSHVAKQSSPRGFGMIFAAVFSVVGLSPLMNGKDVRAWALAVAAGFLLLALVRPSLLSPLNRLWLGFGTALHRIVSPLVMGVMFFAVITPTAVLLRLVGKDLLCRRFSPDAESYWITREPPGPDPQSMRNQF